GFVRRLCSATPSRIDQTGQIAGLRRLQEAPTAPVECGQGISRSVGAKQDVREGIVERGNGGPDEAAEEPHQNQPLDESLTATEERAAFHGDPPARGQLSCERCPVHIQGRSRAKRLPPSEGRSSRQEQADPGDRARRQRLLCWTSCLKYCTVPA